MSQSEFETNTCNRRQARENACGQNTVLVWIPMGWESGAGSFKPITEWNKEPTQSRKYFRHSIKDRFNGIGLKVSELVWIFTETGIILETRSEKSGTGKFYVMSEIRSEFGEPIRTLPPQMRRSTLATARKHWMHRRIIIGVISYPGPGCSKAD